MVNLRWPILKYDQQDLCRHTYPHGTRILTGFPFPSVQLGTGLGPANRQMTNIAGEPWRFRRLGYEEKQLLFLTQLRCYFHQDLHLRVVHTSSRRCFYPHEAPSYPIPFGGRGLGGRLSPFHFQGLHPRRVSCFAVNSNQTKPFLSF